MCGPDQEVEGWLDELTMGLPRPASMALTGPCEALGVRQMQLCRESQLLFRQLKPASNLPASLMN